MKEQCMPLVLNLWKMKKKEKEMLQWGKAISLNMNLLTSAREHLKLMRITNMTKCMKDSANKIESWALDHSLIFKLLCNEARILKTLLLPAPQQLLYGKEVTVITWIRAAEQNELKRPKGRIGIGISNNVAAPENTKTNNKQTMIKQQMLGSNQPFVV